MRPCSLIDSCRFRGSRRWHVRRCGEVRAAVDARPRIDAIPRAYNFAADILGAQPRGRARRQAGLHRSARKLDLWPAGGAGRPLRQRAALARDPPRGAHPARAPRYHRLAHRLPRRHQGRRRPGPGQHADDRGRLPLHARRQPRQGAGRVGGAVSEIRQPDRIEPRSHARHRVGRERARLSPVRGPDRGCAARILRPRRPRATTCASGSTPRARPAGPRARCMCTPICGSPPISMAAACSA